MKDICSKKDIKYVITMFYDKLIEDKEMYPFFENFVREKTLEQHLDVITDFWNDILFDTKDYHQNVMKKHTDKSVFISFKKKHFKLWLHYFNETIDKEFSGMKTVLMKTRAQSIATVMELKMNVY